jgi:hypothetical protein
MRQTMNQSDINLADRNDQSDEGVKKGSSWQRFGLIFFLLALSLAYPVAMGVSHKVTNHIPNTVPRQVWADAKIGTAVELLERESYFGWAASQPVWHPQSRLTAMPAFQQGIGDILSAFAGRRAELLGGQNRDTDLWHAHTLLSKLDDKQAGDRVRASIEALSRFDGRKARALLEDRTPHELLKRDVALFRSELTDAVGPLKEISSRKSRGVFNRENVRVYFHAKGEIHAIAMLLKATNPDEFELEGLNEALENANQALARAAIPAPLTVSNSQPGEFSFEGNDVMQLAFLAMEASHALEALDAVLTEADPSEAS